MAETTSNLNLLERKSFILSILLHILTFGGLIITFPVKDVAHKPLFIFLGSILDRSEFTRLPPKSAPLGEIRIETEEMTMTADSKQQPELLPSNKPAYSRAIAAKPKQLTKSNFLEETLPPATSPSLPDDLLPDKNVFDYQPLSLQGRQ